MRKICLAFLFLAASGLPAAAQVASSDFCSAQLNDAQLLACAKSAAPNSAKSALAYANLGTRAYAQGDMQKAADYYLRSMPGRSVVDIELHVNRADVLAMTGNYELALSDAMIALRMAREGKDRDGPISTEKKWLTLPRLVQLLDLSDSKTARDEAAAMALALPASSADDFSDRAIVLAITDRLDESLLAIDKAIKLSPDVAMLKNNKCATLMRMDRNADALKSCQAAYAADSTDLTIMGSLADAYAKNGRCAEGAQIVSKIKKLFPDSSYADDFECPRKPKT